jgi:3-hydroxy-3-methylglutaryl CoA synthase
MARLRFRSTQSVLDAMRGIVAIGAHIPRLRLSRQSIAEAHAWALPGLRSQAKGSRSFCDWDEDIITMAVEASRGCVAGSDRREVSQLHLASTTYPFDDLQSAGLVAAALALSPNIHTLDYANGQRAVTSGLIESLRHHQTDTTLLVGADAPLGKPGSDQEMQYGAGAAALLVGSENLVASCVGWRSLSAPLIDHFRPKGSQFDYFWEERWIRDEGYLGLLAQTVSGLLEEHGISAGAVQHFIVASAFSNVSAVVAKSLNLPASSIADQLAGHCGYCGTAHPLLMLGRVLEQAKPGDRIVICGFGQGCDAILLEATELVASVAKSLPVTRALERCKTETAYMRLLSFSGQVNYAWGMRAEREAKTALTQHYRASDQILGFIGGKCTNCGTVQFPRLGKCVNPACQMSRSLEPFSLADAPGRVLTFTADWLQYSPSPPFYFGLVQFDNGARVLMEMVDVDAAELRVGLPLRPVFRIKERDALRHFNRYFWKAAPAAAAGG